MNLKPNTSADVTGLRRRAEARLRRQWRNRRSEAGVPKPDADTRRLLQELQIHQIELEMQNAELQKARDDMEVILERYTDLYEFAPVGYFSINAEGLILEVNLTGAALLGVERPGLIHLRLQRFVAPASRTAFLAFLEQIFSGEGKRVCEAALMKEDGTPFWANFHGISAISVSGPLKWCRVAVSDITSLKQAEEAQRRMEILAVTNLDLRREIIRRQAVEEALKKSKQHQSRLLDQSHHMQEQLRHLSHQILQVQEEERKRISRELHDEIAQTLVSINVHLETLTLAAKVNPMRLKREIARTQRLVEKSVNIVHRFARELRPTLLDDLGLIAALHSFMKDFMKRTGIRVHFKTFTASQIAQLDGTMQTALYRVAQEALTNVARHAQAAKVELSIQKQPGALLMQIKDDGKSFNVNQMLHQVLHVKKNKHLGLLGMRERLEMVGGKLVVESSPGKGSTIQARIPFGKAPAKEPVDKAR
jgi:PAS domain S-box-containing protein